jgi:hypothetical protein
MAGSASAGRDCGSSSGCAQKEEEGMRRPKPHITKWTVVMGVKLMRFDTLKEAEEARDKAVERGESAWIQPPLGVRM